MMDFLKAYPSVTKEEYMWEWSVPQIKLAAFDFSHSIFLSEKQKENRKAKNIDIEHISDLGIPIFSDNINDNDKNE